MDPEDKDNGRLHAAIAAIYTGLTGDDAPGDRTEGLLETLAAAYPGDQRNKISVRLLALALVEGAGLMRIIDEHSEGGRDYVASRDMFYRMPEVLLVADLAMTRPRLLDQALRNTDFEDLIAPMAAEFAELASRHARWPE